MPAAERITASSKSAGESVRFRTFGSFRVSIGDDLDLTPKSHKAQGLLAILLTSPDLRRPRAKLQDLLWSDRAQPQGAASLRQVLTVLRKAFGEHSDVLQSDRVFVWLDESRIETDCDLNGPTVLADLKNREFLEGNTVKDPEFTDWLRDRRLEYEDIIPEADAGPRSGVKSEKPKLYLSYGSAAGSLAAYLANAISGGVKDWVPVEIREGKPETREPALLLETDEVRFGNDAFIQVVLRDTSKRETLWRSAMEFDAAGQVDFRTELTRLINESVDRTISSLSFDLEGLVPQNANAAIQAIEQMFVTHGRAYEELARVFEDEYAASGHGVFLAWRAFLTTYVVGGRQAHDRFILAEEARGYVQRALFTEPHNPLVLALCSHVNAFTLGDHESAFELADRSVRLQSANPLGWVFRGVALVNLGRLDEGRASIAKARETAGEAPYRYLIDCYSCIAEMLCGDLQTAVRFGRTSLTYAPDFAPTLRYLLATHLKSGDTEAAEKTVARLRALEPDFEIPLFAEPEYPVPLMRKYSVLDLGKLPKLL